MLKSEVPVLEKKIQEAHSQIKLQWVKLDEDISKYKEHIGASVGSHIDEQI